MEALPFRGRDLRLASSFRRAVWLCSFSKPSEIDTPLAGEEGQGSERKGPFSGRVPANASLHPDFFTPVCLYLLDTGLFCVCRICNSQPDDTHNPDPDGAYGREL